MKEHETVIKSSKGGKPKNLHFPSLSFKPKKDDGTIDMMKLTFCIWQYYWKFNCSNDT